jgi:hypothetical protein
MGLFGNIGNSMAATIMNRIKNKNNNDNNNWLGVQGGDSVNASKTIRYVGDPVAQGLKATHSSLYKYKEPESRGTFADPVSRRRSTKVERNPVGNSMAGRSVLDTNQLTSTAINPSAFDTGTVGQVFNSNNVNGYTDPTLSNTQDIMTPITQKKYSPLKQVMNNSVDPLTGQHIDPTMSQDLNPGTVDPMLDQEDTSLTQY